MDAPITQRSIPQPPQSCENSLRETSSRQAMLTTDPLRMCVPATSTDTRNAIFSQAADCGPLQPDLPDGLTTDLFGPAPVRASRSARRARVSEQMIQGICGRTFIASSVPVGPLSSWESRLRERLATLGSTESALIWRSKNTPAGASISRLAPSMRHTNGTDFTGSPWQTPLASDVRKQSENPETTIRRADKNQMIGLNAHMALIAFNPTPDASCGGPDPSSRKTGKSVQTIMASYNPTPTVADVQGGQKTRSGARKNEPLLNGLMTAYSPTTTSLSFKESHQPGNSRSLNLMRAHFETALGGPTSNGSSAPSTAKRGAPNPAFPFWLMGFPDEWTSGALAAMQSFRSSRRKSSRRFSKQKQSEARHD